MEICIGIRMVNLIVAVGKFCCCIQFSFDICAYLVHILCSYHSSHSLSSIYSPSSYIDYSHQAVEAGLKITTRLVMMDG